MTESEWQTCTHAPAMLHWQHGRTSRRKFRLFACACSRRLWKQISEPRSRNAVLVAERYADGLATRKELEAARAAAPGRGIGRMTEFPAKIAAAAALPTADRAAEISAALLTVSLMRTHTIAASEGEMAALVRHVFPWQPARSAPTELPATVVEMAASLYQGDDCVFALHDALLDAGLMDFAEHFREPWHPKGCWALDLLLGRR